MKKILIETCRACPHQGHNGGFAPIAYVPICRKADRELPHTVGTSKRNPTAISTYEIPEWCLLEDN